MAEPVQLIVVVAFDPDPETGELLAAIEPIQADSQARAVSLARDLERKHSGVIAWARMAKPDIGEYGEPEVLYQAGDVPTLE